MFTSRARRLTARKFSCRGNRRAGEWIMSFMEGTPAVVPYGETVNHPGHEDSFYLQIGDDL